jgi:hypothetical protein
VVLGRKRLSGEERGANVFDRNGFDPDGSLALEDLIGSMMCS